MKKIYISSLDKTRKHLYISSLSSFLSKDGKVLIINMDNNRDLEIEFEIEDFIIYDNLDYFKGICDLEQSIQEVDENIFLMPSAFKTDKYVMDNKDFKSIDKIEGFDYIILNGEDVDKYIEDMDIILDYIDEKSEGYFYINNRNMEKKVNSKKYNTLQDKNIRIIGDLEIDNDMNSHILNNIWKIYVGEDVFTVEKNIFERIFNK